MRAIAGLRISVLSGVAVVIGVLPGLVWGMDTTINAGNRTYYGPNGNGIVPDSAVNQWVVCDPTAKISHCCKLADYCMSNGLCFDAGGHNSMSIQGCTDPTWQGGSCRKLCPTIDTLWPCNQDFSLFACHGDCASDNFTLPVGQIMGVGHTIGICSTPLQTSVGLSPTQSACGTAAANSASGTSAAAPMGSTQQQGTDTKSLTIGLGAGIPLGIVLVCALFFVGYQMRRSRTNLKPTGSRYYAEKPQSHFSSPSDPNNPHCANTDVFGGASPTAVYAHLTQGSGHEAGRSFHSLQNNERRQDGSRLHEMSSLAEVHEIGGR